jgi:hypothetical protein
VDFVQAGQPLEVVVEVAYLIGWTVVGPGAS